MGSEEAVLHIREMQLSDVNRVVDVHLSSFEGFFLTFLGPRFLSLLYGHIVSSPHGIGYVCLDDGSQIVGFVCGSTQPSGFYRRFFKSECWHIILATVHPFMRRPGIGPRLVRAVLWPAQTPTGSENATLLSLAVLPKRQNNGIGGALVRRFLVGMRLRGVQCVNVTTDMEGNDAVNAFYHRLGFQVVGSFVTPEGRRMNEYAFSLSSGESRA